MERHKSRAANMEKEEKGGGSDEAGTMPGQSTDRSPSSTSSFSSAWTKSQTSSDSSHGVSEIGVSYHGGKTDKVPSLSVWASFKKAGEEFNQDTRKMFQYIGWRLHGRHRRDTKVKEIRILPRAEGNLPWARPVSGRSGSSGCADDSSSESCS